MSKKALLAVFCFFALVTRGQELRQSRIFPTNRKNVPVEIFNKSPYYFYVLRYNKIIHDLILEKRSKPGAEIIHIIPLRLDSVNANWFDYERLEYLLHQSESGLHFVFEKTLNNQKSIFLRSVDSSGRARGFKELLSFNRNRETEELKSSFKITSGGDLLIICSRIQFGGVVKKSAHLYSFKESKWRWQKDLPIESPTAGYSSAHDCDAEGELYFLHLQSHFSGFLRKYNTELQQQVEVPQFTYSAVRLMLIPNGKDTLVKRKFELPELSDVKYCGISLLNRDPLMYMHCCIKDSANEKVYFFAAGFTAGLSSSKFSTLTKLSDYLDKKLEYYDGTDKPFAAHKGFNLLHIYTSNDLACFVSGRRDENFHKELLVWQMNYLTGEVHAQNIIPRKIFFFKERSNFKQLGGVQSYFSGQDLYLLLLENQGNRNQVEADFDSFKKQIHLRDGQLVVYKINREGSTGKKIIYENREFDFVPIKTTGNQKEIVVYLNRGKAERFAILELDWP